MKAVNDVRVQEAELRQENAIPEERSDEGVAASRVVAQPSGAAWNYPEESDTTWVSSGMMEERGYRELDSPLSG
jgi:hypothetical protein